MQENLLCKFDLSSASGWIFNDGIMIEWNYCERSRRMRVVLFTESKLEN